MSAHRHHVPSLDHQPWSMFPSLFVVTGPRAPFDCPCNKWYSEHTGGGPCCNRESPGSLPFSSPHASGLHSESGAAQRIAPAPQPRWRADTCFSSLREAALADAYGAVADGQRAGRLFVACTHNDSCGWSAYAGRSSHAAPLFSAVARARPRAKQLRAGERRHGVLIARKKAFRNAGKY
ncbi:hypothetical protein GGX14DRAFT_398843 [Mycena pura]|uniref:Uncharacterized protein n=1 Tax=Mycena pura TaxID=153505 RepID=A0AAD6V677_9AGAR|nr:hypothetical protein GGX14DRAFT_398843 [Mycena pura]